MNEQNIKTILDYKVTIKPNVLPDPSDYGGLIGIEAKNIQWVPKDDMLARPDMHYVMEVYQYKDGTQIRNFKPIANFKREFWITKPHKQNHKDKKESESLENLNSYRATQSDLYKEVATRLGGRYVGCKYKRDVAGSPYVYGLDIDGRDELAYLYRKRYPHAAITPNIVATLDIEIFVDTKEVIVATVTCRNTISTFILKSFLPHTNKVEEILEKMAKKYFPDKEVANRTNFIYTVCDTEIDLIRKCINQVHTWQPDFLAVWNVDFDIPHMIERAKLFEVDAKDIFSDPRLKPEYKYFYYKKSQSRAVSASGKPKNSGPEERWSIFNTPSTFYIIDQMCTYNFVRSGGKRVPGGYGFDNLSKFILGDSYGKVKIPDDVSDKYFGEQWHYFMSKNRPLEYVVYNQWDAYGMQFIDRETKDLETKIRPLSGMAHYDMFKSGPKKIMMNMHYFCLEKGYVIGTRDPNIAKDDEETEPDENGIYQDLADWIIALPIDTVADGGYGFINGCENLPTKIRLSSADSDQVSGYPNDGLSANVSKDTTSKELKTIGEFDNDTIKHKNINFMFGKVNRIDYVSTLFQAPTLEELKEKITL